MGALLFFLSFMLVASVEGPHVVALEAKINTPCYRSASEVEAWWKKILPNTPMPPAITGHVADHHAGILSQDQQMKGGDDRDDLKNLNAFYGYRNQRKHEKNGNMYYGKRKNQEKNGNIYYGERKNQEKNGNMYYGERKNQEKNGNMYYGERKQEKNGNMYYGERKQEKNGNMYYGERKQEKNGNMYYGERKKEKNSNIYYGERKQQKNGNMYYGERRQKNDNTYEPMDNDDLKNSNIYHGMEHLRDAHFISEEVLTPGSMLKPYVLPASLHGAFLHRDMADSITLSTEKYEDILTMFAPASLSMADDIWSSLDVCEYPNTVEGEIQACITSIESMVELVESVLGTSDIRAFSSSDVPAEGVLSPSKTYVVVTARAVTIPGSKATTLACHGLPFPYALFYCHAVNPTAVYDVTLQSVEEVKTIPGTTMRALVMCHLNTSGFDPNILFFVVRNLKPGNNVTVCHFLSRDSVVWVLGAQAHGHENVAA